jgi:hypothetical protein
VAVRPYRYAHGQKPELERQYDMMLQQGVICPSCSAFSAPVLLVKKADDSQRFCVDYIALNVRMVKDKFPIPMIEELLDELRGTMFFTKLDLRSGYECILKMWRKRHSERIKGYLSFLCCLSVYQMRR